MDPEEPTQYQQWVEAWEVEHKPAEPIPLTEEDIRIMTEQYITPFLVMDPSSVSPPTNLN